MKLLAPSESTLLDAARLLIPGASNRTLRQLLEHGRIRLNDAICRIASARVRAGDRIELSPREYRRTDIHGLKVVFEDKDILLVEKPVGLLTVATPHEHEKTAYAYLRAYLKDQNPRQKLFIVHRLDKFASGVLVFAKSEAVQNRLKALFRSHNIGRKYWAVVEGRIEQQRGTIRSRLAENRAGRMHSTREGKAGKEAVTHFRVLRRFPRQTLLEITLETGRKNQIRVHLADLGHPIVGDRAYGSTMNPMGRLGLHAFLLEFQHPTLGTPVRYKTGTPPEFRHYLSD